MSVIVSIPDRHITEPMQEIAKHIAAGASVSRVTVWMEAPGKFGLTFIEDELAQTGFFQLSDDGDAVSLIGDWM